MGRESAIIPPAHCPKMPLPISTAYYQNYGRMKRIAPTYLPKIKQIHCKMHRFLKQTTSNLFSDQQIGCLPYRAGIKSRNYENLSIGSGVVNIGSEANGGELTEKADTTLKRGRLCAVFP
ncbi:MAG: hypothetical protein ACLUMK_00720 [Christensenellales bacterium]